MPMLFFLQETWLPQYSESALSSDYPDYRFLISSDDLFSQPEDRLGLSDHVWHGTAIGWHRDLHSSVKQLKLVNERFAGIKIECGKMSVLALSLYLPTSGKDDEFSECLSSLSNFIDENCDPSDSILIGADTNCSEKSTPRRRRIFNNFCQQQTLKKAGSLSSTFHHNNSISESNIDTFLISQNLLEFMDQVTVKCTLDEPLNFSCHDLLQSCLALPLMSSEQRSTHSDTYSDYNRVKVLWEKSDTSKYQVLAGSFLSQAESYFDSPEYIPLKCNMYSNLLVTAATATCAVNQSKPYHSKPKLSCKLKLAKSNYRRKYKIWNNQNRNKDNPIYSEYLAARKNLQHTVRYEDNLNNIKFNNKLMDAHARDKNKVYSLVKKSRGVVSRTETSLLETPVGTFAGQDILEGFTADAEFLGKADGECQEYDNEFYRMCIMDNFCILKFKGERTVKIPHMTMDDLNRILFSRMKPGKAPDIHHLTVEHLRNAGDKAKLCVLNLVNSILDEIYYLTCPQAKMGISSVIYKGKKKPVSNSDSYRRVTVSPQIGSIIDRYIDPVAEEIFREVQSPDQLGFTAGISYLMAAVQRGECQRWALDKKLTCFGVSFDGRAAFPSVDRDIQIRELYSAGEDGDLLMYSNNTYQNTEAKIKMNNKLSRQFETYKGSRQGHIRASGHFKAYINPCLTAVNQSNLGFNIGPICVTAVCVADDAYVLSDCPRKLQGAIDIVGHYGKRYRVIFNAGKTKATITGSNIDMQYYKDIKMWTLHEETIAVTDDNEHLGLIVSGQDEEAKNVDQNIQVSRSSLFALLGVAFSFKSKVSPTVQIHLWRTYCQPVLRSGLAALPVRPAQFQCLTVFHHKVLRGFLKLSSTSPVPALYFLLGEMPMQAHADLDVLGLFHTIWSNPDTTIHEVIKYILKMSDDSSVTWAVHVRILCQQYDLPDPLRLLQQEDAWPKSKWRNWCTTRVRAYHEKYWKEKSLTNSKMLFLHVQLLGLNGRHHPALFGLQTTRQVEKMRPHLKMLSGDYLTYSRIALDRKAGDPSCRICRTSPSQLVPPETIEHLLTECKGTAEVRERIFPELLNALLLAQPNHPYLSCPPAFHKLDITLAQFILDCTSFNLHSLYRLNINNDKLTTMFQVSRDFCYAVHSIRLKQLKVLKEK